MSSGCGGQSSSVSLVMTWSYPVGGEANRVMARPWPEGRPRPEDLVEAAATADPAAPGIWGRLGRGSSGRRRLLATRAAPCLRAGQPRGRGPSRLLELRPGGNERRRTRRRPQDRGRRTVGSTCEVAPPPESGADGVGRVLCLDTDPRALRQRIKRPRGPRHTLTRKAGRSHRPTRL